MAKTRKTTIEHRTPDHEPTTYELEEGEGEEGEREEDLPPRIRRALERARRGQNLDRR